MSEPLTREEIAWIKAANPKGTIAAYFGQKALAECDTLRARCEQLEQLYSHKDLDFECAERGCKSTRSNKRCEQLEAALLQVVGHWPIPVKLGAHPSELIAMWQAEVVALRKIAADAVANSTIASESTG